MFFNDLFGHKYFVGWLVSIDNNITDILETKCCVGVGCRFRGNSDMLDLSKLICIQCATLYSTEMFGLCCHVVHASSQNMSFGIGDLAGGLMSIM